MTSINYLDCKTWTNDIGDVHRTDGPAKIWEDGSYEYWLNGKLHREDGPAICWVEDREEWWFYDVLHRSDGPAVIFLHDEDYPMWYINGKNISNKVIKWMKRHQYTWTLENQWDDEIKTHFKLTFLVNEG